MTALLVYNIEAASPSMIRSLDRHCNERIPDGTSAIDLERSHLNETLVGSEEGLFASLQKFFEGGPKPPAKQAEKPYLRIVVSASAEYFRPNDPDALGTWDQDRLDAWREATMDHLRAEHGEDLIYAELHLDEDTPHIHAVVAPTYRKKPRRPGKQKRGETKEQFTARKAAAEVATGERVVGRASHPELSKLGSFQRLRERMAVALEHLGIEYGEDRQGQADAKITRQWVKEQAAEIRKKQAELSAQQAEFSAREVELDEREALAAKSLDEISIKEEVLSDRSIELSQQEEALSAREGDLAKGEEKLAERDGLLTRWSVENLEKQKELDQQRAILSKSQQSLHDRQNSIDAAEAILAARQKDFELALAGFRDRETKLVEREKSLESVFRQLKGLMYQIGSIVKACSKRFGLPVPQELDTIKGIQVVLSQLEEHKPKPSTALDPVDDDWSLRAPENSRDETLGGPGF